jgi:hypothetical protein
VPVTLIPGDAAERFIAAMAAPWMEYRQAREQYVTEQWRMACANYRWMQQCPHVGCRYERGWWALRRGCMALRFEGRHVLSPGKELMRRDQGLVAST